MDFLVGDVVGDGGDAVGTDGAGVIRALPAEVGSLHFVGEEVAGRAFDVADDLRDGSGGGQSDKNVDMVGDAADGEQVGLHFAAAGGDAGVEARLEVGRNQGLTIPGGPGAVEIDFGVGVGHRRIEEVRRTRVGSRG